MALVAIGTRGDVQPMVALALALRERGHQVRVGAPPDFGPWITTQGLDFVPVGVDVQRYLTDHPDLFSGAPRRALAAARHFFNQEIPAQARDMTPLCRWADVVAWGGLAMVAQHVAESCRRPSLGVLYSPCVLPSELHAPAAMPYHGLPTWLNRWLWRLSQWSTERIGGQPINRVRATLGLPPVELREHMFEQGRLLMAADAELFPHDPNWPASVKSTSFIFHDDPQPLDPSLSEWLAEGPPPVWIGFGSMGGDHARRVEDLLLPAMTRLGMRYLIGSGWAGLGQGALPAGWRVVREAPHPRLFPRMAAVVHHGGSGTTANALRAGVPQLIVPLILDQHYHAHCLYKAGLMPKPVPMTRMTADRLADGLRWVMDHGAPLRQAAAERLQRSDARGDIARELEALAQGSNP